MRKSPLPRRNPARARAKYARNFGGEWLPEYDHRAHVVEQLCALRFALDRESLTGDMHRCRYTDPIDPAHVEARGMGGAKGNWRKIVPLCREAHRIFDEECANDPARFKERFGVDLTRLAAELAAEAEKRMEERNEREEN